MKIKEFKGDVIFFALITSADGIGVIFNPQDWTARIFGVCHPLSLSAFLLGHPSIPSPSSSCFWSTSSTLSYYITRETCPSRRVLFDIKIFFEKFSKTTWQSCLIGCIIYTTPRESFLLESSLINRIQKSVLFGFIRKELSAFVWERATLFIFLPPAVIVRPTPRQGVDAHSE